MLGVQAAGQSTASQGGDALERGEDSVGGRKATLGDQIGYQRLDRGVLYACDGTPQQNAGEHEWERVGQRECWDSNDHGRHGQQNGWAPAVVGEPGHQCCHRLGRHRCGVDEWHHRRLDQRGIHEVVGDHPEGHQAQRPEGA